VSTLERCLGEVDSGNQVKDVARKIQWQVSRKDELAKLMAKV